MELQAFIEILYKAGWTSPCDAQHEHIQKVWEDLHAKLKEAEEKAAKYLKAYDEATEKLIKADSEIVRLCSIEGAKLSQYRELMETLSVDMHHPSKRPCDTCREATKLFEKPYGCYAYQAKTIPIPEEVENG